MTSDGGNSGTLLTCARDEVATRLQCAGCQTPICPACYVRTAVGLKCEPCGAASGPVAVVAEGGGRRRRVALAALAGAVTITAVTIAAVLLVRDEHGGPAEEVSEGGERVSVPVTVLGTGQFPGGGWTLEARRDGVVCTTLILSPGPPARERCIRSRSYRPVGNLSTWRIGGPDATTYVVLGQASDRAERVRVAPEGTVPWEVPALGGGTGLEIRFFVAHTTSNVPVTFTALAADGTELGRTERPALPDRPVTRPPAPPR